jgi:hypothetical protein
MSDFVDDVNRHDKTAFGQLLAEDAEFVVITGQYLRGRSEIEKYHAEIWTTSSNFKDSRLTWTPMTSAFSGPMLPWRTSPPRGYTTGPKKREQWS